MKLAGWIGSRSHQSW